MIISIIIFIIPINLHINLFIKKNKDGDTLLLGTSFVSEKYPETKKVVRADCNVKLLLILLFFN